jgi:hypothetical protein
VTSDERWADWSTGQKSDRFNQIDGRHRVREVSRNTKADAFFTVTSLTLR